MQRLLANLECLLESTLYLFELLTTLLAHRQSLLATQKFIRTFQILLEKAIHLLENIYAPTPLN